LLDRFDLRVGVRRTTPDDLLQSGGGESTERVRTRVERARSRAQQRIGMSNGAIPPAELDACAPVTPDARALSRSELERGRLTGRGYHRVRRVARTIADLDEADHALVAGEHVALALTFRVRLRVASGRDAA
jgi:magnesium chelatase family protein